MAISGYWWLLVAISGYWWLLVAISGYWSLLVAIISGRGAGMLPMPTLWWALPGWPKSPGYGPGLLELLDLLV